MRAVYAGVIVMLLASPAAAQYGANPRIIYLEPTTTASISPRELREAPVERETPAAPVRKAVREVAPKKPIRDVTPRKPFQQDTPHETPQTPLASTTPNEPAQDDDVMPAYVEPDRRAIDQQRRMTSPPPPAPRRALLARPSLSNGPTPLKPMPRFSQQPPAPTESDSNAVESNGPTEHDAPVTAAHVPPPAVTLPPPETRTAPPAEPNKLIDLPPVAPLD